MTDRALTIGIDLGGTFIKAGLVDGEGAILSRASVATDLSRGPAGLLADMAGLVKALLGSPGDPGRRNDLIAVGLGSPGPLSPSRGLIYKCANLPGLEGFAIRDELGEKLGMPVAFDNDGNMAALGESWLGGGRGAGDMVMLTLGTGVGAGVIVDGVLLHGHFENAAELGHMIVQAGGLPCTCGQSGCLERYCSASSVARRAKEALGEGRSSRLTELVAEGEEITSEHVARAAREGDTVCHQIWDEACVCLAVACVNIQHTFNPARIVIGGGMSAAGDFLFDCVRGHFERQRWSLAEDFPKIVPAELGNDAGMLGAAKLARDSGGG